MWKIIERLLGLKGKSVAMDKKEGLGKFFLFFEGKGHQELMALPVNFDLEKHLAKHPPLGWDSPQKKKLNFEADKCYAILGLLSSIPARNSDVIYEDGIPISSTRVTNSIKDFAAYTKYLIATEVICCDYLAIEGKKCYHYKWASPYAEALFHLIKVPCKYADDVAKYEKESTDFVEYPYLFHWYSTHLLAIDPRATHYAWLEKGDKEADATRKLWSKSKTTGAYIHPKVQYQAITRNIGKLQHARYEAHIDENIHRLHSTLTNLKKEFRNFLTYNQEPLKAIDITNCQPYIATLILKKEFWQQNSPLPLSLSSLPNNIQSLITADLSIMIGTFLEQTPQEKFEGYIGIAKSGLVYEGLRDKVIELFPDLSYSRDQAKILMFYILFSSNKGQSNDPQLRQMKKAFAKEMFPEVAELFKMIKHNFKEIKNLEKQHSRLSCLLQSIESYIMLHRCCKRIWEERGGEVPIFTIHDSIATTPQYIDYVREVVMEEFEYCIGIAPKLETEQWEVGKLNQELLKKAQAEVYQKAPL